MYQQALPSEWTLTNLSDGHTLPAKIPGSIYSALLDAGEMADPFWRDNEDMALALMDFDYRFSCHFVPSSDILASRKVLLHCDGIDTVADVTLNGTILGHTENMHRIWEFDVTKLLLPEDNILEVTIYSPTNYIAAKYAEVNTDGSTDAMYGFSQLRKAHCMFGWDWGPRLPDGGIWREISLLGVDVARICDVYITQSHTPEFVELTAKVNTEGGNCTAQFTATGPDGEGYTAKQGADSLRIPNPQLWWPNGYGAQPLYTVTVRLLNDDGNEIDCWERRIGLRTMGILNEPDQWGESFALKVNGVTVFSMGADYIPEDNILSRTNPTRTRELLEQCILANMNSVRVWGGGHYPSDAFYDICDELGLVVWQDFMFACAIYEPSEEFTANIRAELIDNIRRIRHHASLGLWCGNNEMEWQVDEKVYVFTPAQHSYYTQMYEEIFPELLKEHDPNTFYWPSSPSSGGAFDEPNDPNRGDVHYWDVWHREKPFTAYRNYFFRYASEFGFQSFPSMKTIAAFTEPGDRNLVSYIMEKHQRNASANNRIIGYMAQTFRFPERFEDVVYASQLLQADAIRYGVEHWRRNRGRCMGAIYWQLNDCWPVISWASIDYFGRWKPLHYYARRFFAPIMLSCEENGSLIEQQNVNAQQIGTIHKTARLSVANETFNAFSGTVYWALRNPDASVIREGSTHIDAPALTSIWLDTLVLDDACAYENYLSYTLTDSAGAFISEGTVLFCAPKHFRFVDPRLSCETQGDEITIRASAYARAVEIDCPDTDMVLSDNYFDMNAGEKTIRLLHGKIGNLRLKSVYDIGR